MTEENSEEIEKTNVDKQNCVILLINAFIA
jgi:hypothetical protein